MTAPREVGSSANPDVVCVIGTYLADYMGILQPAKVTGFPFSLLENPMYDGSTMCFVAT